MNWLCDLVRFTSINKLPQVVQWTLIVHGRQCQNGTQIASNRHFYQVFMEGKPLNSQVFTPPDHFGENGKYIACLLLSALENEVKENNEFRALNSQLRFCKMI